MNMLRFWIIALGPSLGILMAGVCPTRLSAWTNLEVQGDNAPSGTRAAARAGAAVQIERGEHANLTTCPANLTEPRIDTHAMENCVKLIV